MLSAKAKTLFLFSTTRRYHSSYAILAGIFTVSPFSSLARRSNSTHISLYVSHDEGGFRLTLAGSARTRTIETVKFYLAIRKAGYPVLLRDGAILANRLLETERVGIVPEGITPCYCESLFPDEHIIDFINLPSENRQLVAEHSVWQEIKPVEII